MWLENIENRESYFGDTDVVCAAGSDFATTFVAVEFVVPCVDVACTDFGLEVPVASEYPLIAVCYACAGVAGFVAEVLDFLLEVFAAEEESGHGKIDVGSVELTAKGVDTDETAVELGAVPPAVFGLDYPVLCFPDAAIVGPAEAPRVETVDYIHCRSARQA